MEWLISTCAESGNKFKKSDNFAEAIGLIGSMKSPKCLDPHTVRNQLIPLFPKEVYDKIRF